MILKLLKKCKQKFNLKKKTGRNFCETHCKNRGTEITLENWDEEGSYFLSDLPFEVHREFMFREFRPEEFGVDYSGIYDMNIYIGQDNSSQTRYEFH